jgi:hypothetical protein
MNRCFIQHSFLDWQNILDVASRKWKTKKMLGVLCRLVLSSSVYHIWKARNEIKLQGHPKTKEQILRLIFWEVRNRISGRGKFIKNGENMDLCRLWNIDEGILV